MNITKNAMHSEDLSTQLRRFDVNGETISNVRLLSRQLLDMTTKYWYVGHISDIMQPNNFDSKILAVLKKGTVFSDVYYQYYILDSYVTILIYKFIA